MVSVIVTTKNEQAHIRDCLESIRNQSYSHIEIIVVDNGSTDKTVEIAGKMGARVFRRGPERSAQRNFGASHSKGKYVLFLDADMKMSRDVISTCVVACDPVGAKAAVIPEESFGQGFWSECKSLERTFYLGLSWIEAARFYERKSFLESGGYDELMTGPEDFDLSQRFKDKYGPDAVQRVRARIYHNEGKSTFVRYIRKKFYYAQNVRNYKNKMVNKEYYRMQTGVISRYGLFFSDPGKLLAHPIVGIGMLVLKTAEFIAGGLGYMYAFIRNVR